MTLCLLILSISPAAKAEAPEKVSLKHGQTLTISIPGATAAFSLNPFYAEASAQDEQVTVSGKNPGSTHIQVVVTGEDHFFEVVVGEPELVYPPGFVAPVDPNTSVLGSGGYELRFVSNPSLIQNVMNFARREGNRTAQFRLSGALVMEREPDQSLVSFPTSFYEVRSPQRDIALLDKEVVNSPLTLYGSPVRGIFWREGPWRVHAGYSFYTNFESLFLPKQREGVAGLSYRRGFGTRGHLTPSLYYFPSEHGGGKRGFVSSLNYELQPREGLTLLAEAGFSRGLGVAGRLAYEKQGERIAASLRHVPKNFASLSINGLHGSNADLYWTKRKQRLTWDLMLSANRYIGPTFRQDNTVASFGLSHQITPRWSLNEGVGYSAFQSRERIRSLNLPVGLGFHVQHFAASAQYQYSRNAGRDLGGHQLRTGINMNKGGWRASVHMDRQTEAPAPSYIIAQFPGLQPILDQLGVGAVTSKEVSEFLQKSNVLAALGYTEPLHINLAPLRVQYSGTLGWNGSGRYSPRISLSALYNRTLSVNGGLQSAIYTAGITQRLTRTTELFVSYSMLRSQPYGMPATYSPVAMVSLRKNLRSAPSFLLPERSGAVSGVVFRDDQGAGKCEGMPGIPGAEVILDGNQRTHTDQNGRFRFEDIAYGEHMVEVKFSADRPFYLTTPSPVKVTTERRVCFGIGFALSRIIGHVRNDAGTGQEGLEIRARGGGREFTARTDAEGRFTIAALPPGQYEVRINPNSVPPGYSLETLKPEKVQVQPATPGRVVLNLKPFRNVSGHVRVFDRTSGTYKAVPGLTVRVTELGRTSKSGADGLYLFRDLPPGTYTLAVEHEGILITRPVTVEDSPTFLKNMDLQIAAK